MPNDDHAHSIALLHQALIDLTVVHAWIEHNHRMLRTELPALDPPAHHRKIYGAYKDALSQSFLSTQPSKDDFRVFVLDNFSGDEFDPNLCRIA